MPKKVSFTTKDGRKVSFKVKPKQKSRRRRSNSQKKTQKMAAKAMKLSYDRGISLKKAWSVIKKSNYDGDKNIKKKRSNAKKA
jgi:hypothetical protein